MSVAEDMREYAGRRSPLLKGDPYKMLVEAVEKKKRAQERTTLFHESLDAAKLGGFNLGYHKGYGQGFDEGAYKGYESGRDIMEYNAFQKGVWYGYTAPDYAEVKKTGEGFNKIKFTDAKELKDEGHWAFAGSKAAKTQNHSFAEDNQKIVFDRKKMKGANLDGTMALKGLQTTSEKPKEITQTAAELEKKAVQLKPEKIPKRPNLYEVSVPEKAETAYKEFIDNLKKLPPPPPPPQVRPLRISKRVKEVEEVLPPPPPATPPTTPKRGKKPATPQTAPSTPAKTTTTTTTTTTPQKGTQSAPTSPQKNLSPKSTKTAKRRAQQAKRSGKSPIKFSQGVMDEGI